MNTDRAPGHQPGWRQQRHSPTTVGRQGGTSDALRALSAHTDNVGVKHVPPVTSSAQTSPPLVRRATDVSRLADKMRGRNDAKDSAKTIMKLRSAEIQDRYVPHMDAWRSQAGTLPGRRPTTPATNFDRGRLLAEMIENNNANFHQLDRQLLEDHTIASRRLHSAVFAHTNDFLLLFRDVDRASTLVETLKAHVQGTKAAVSSISRFTQSGAGSLTSSGDAHLGKGSPARGIRSTSVAGASLKGRSRPVPGATFEGKGVDGAILRRPSLITKRFCFRSSKSDEITSQHIGRSVQPSTRVLNVASVLQWRLLVGAGVTIRRSAYNGKNTSGNSIAGNDGIEDARWTASGDVEKSKREIQTFVDIVREEVDRLLTQRQHMQAAELLRSVEAEGVAKGCLPLLLDLEAGLVRSIVQSLHDVPISAMYIESVHVPLVQLLLRFGRVERGCKEFLDVQTAWFQSELQKLQARVNPKHSCLVVTDFLVCAMRNVLHRQHTLWFPLEEARQLMKSKDELQCQDPGMTPGPTASELAPCGTQDMQTSLSISDNQRRIPPNSFALIWVRQNVERLVQEVLSTHVLSYGTGTDGGDPTRFRRAVTMTAEVIRVLRTMTREGFAGCDTVSLRQLTPSLVVLQNDFAKLTGERMHNTGRAMVDQLISSCLHTWKVTMTSSSDMRVAVGRTLYNPSACEDVAHKNNNECHELLRVLKQLPVSSHTLLLQLLLAPASSSVFDSACTGRKAAASSGFHAANNVVASYSPAKQLLLPDQYSFLRYANGCTALHGLLVSSLLRFVAAMAGSDRLPVMQELSTAPQTLAGNRSECAMLLLTNALVTESLDATTEQLFASFILTTLRQRRTLAQFLTSEEFTSAHGEIFPPCNLEDVVDEALPPMCDPAQSPAWVLDGMMSLLSDVLSVGVWVSYLARGGAVAHLLADPSLTFRTLHVEVLRQAMPTLVQGWMISTLVIGFRIKDVPDLLPSLTDSSMAEVVPSMAAATSKVLKRTTSSAQFSTASRSFLPCATFSNNTAAMVGAADSEGSVGGEEVYPSLAPCTAKGANWSPPFEGSPMRACAPFTFEDSEDRDVVSVPVAVTEDRDKYSSNPFGTMEPGAAAVYGTTNALLAEANVKEAKLLPLLMDLLERQYCNLEEVEGGFAWYRLAGEFHCSVTSSNDSPPRLWSVRAVLQQYPRFPIGGQFNRADEMFLFHWCVQITLNLLALLQDRLLIPSYVVNARAAAKSPMSDTPLPIQGCVAPQDDSVLASLAAGGGNYVAAVALLQFLVVRLLRDVLCRVETWTAVYGCPFHEWRSDDFVLRQQLFFFALLLRLWAPLFSGGLSVPVVANTGSAGSSCSREAHISTHNVDNVPSVAVLEWLTCGGVLLNSRPFNGTSVLQPSSTLASGAKTTTAIDAFFRGDRLPAMPDTPGATVASDDPMPKHGPSPKSDVHAAGDNSSPRHDGIASASLPSRPSGLFLPDTLVCVVRVFFEDRLCDARAMPALTSELMQQRVNRALTSTNLCDYIHHSLMKEDEDAESSQGSSEDSRGYETDDDPTTTSRHSQLNTGTPRRKELTLLDIRQLLTHYMMPFL